MRVTAATRAQSYLFLALLPRRVLPSRTALVYQVRILILTIMVTFNTLTAMKKLVYTLTAISALLCSCVNNQSEINFVEGAKTVAVEVTADNSRTYFEGEQILWAESGEALNIIYFAEVEGEAMSRRQTSTHQDYTVKDNCAEFSADFNSTSGATKYTFGAFYPYASKLTTSSINLTVPQTQTPSLTSYDPATDILVSTNPVVTETLPNKISFTFARMVAFAKMTIEGIGEGEKIQKVVFSSPTKPAGAVEFKVHAEATVENAKWYNNFEDITINLEGRTATGKDTVWFTTVPTDLSGSSFTVTVTTDKFNYTKTVDLTGKTLTFERADVAVFTVKDIVKQEKPQVYKLLTDVAELTAGDKVIITNKNIESTTVRVMMTTMNGTNKIKLSSDYATITPSIEIEANALPENTAVFTVEQGATAGTFAFKAEGAGYLNGEYDDENWSSFLNYSSTLEAGASWTVELISNGAKMSSCYNGSSTRYLNNSDNYNMNYANSRGTSYHYHIFYIDGAATEEPETPENPVVTPLEAPVVTATATANTVTVEWTAVEGAKDYTVVCGEQSVTVAATTATFENVAAGSYKVVVTANPADKTLHIASTSTAVEVVVEDAPAQGGEAQTITLAFPADMPAGVNSGDTVGTIYNGDVTISSKGSWRIGKSDGRDCIYIGKSTTNDFTVVANSGKVITKITLTAPVGHQIDLKAKDNDTFNTTTFATTSVAEWTGECRSRVVFTAAGNAHSNIATITVEYK